MQKLKTMLQISHLIKATFERIPDSKVGAISSFSEFQLQHKQPK